MGLQYTFELIKTSDNAEISSRVALTTLRFDNIRVTESLGNELLIDSGDLTFTVNAELDFDAAFNNWIALFVNGSFYNIYTTELPYSASNPGYEEYDEKYGRYKYRLVPLSRRFWKNMSEKAIEYTTETTDWNYDLGNATEAIAEIEIQNENGSPLTALDQIVFAPTEMLAWMTQGKHDSNGYQINNLIFDEAPLFHDDDMLLIHRGSSVSVGTSDEDAINQTFKTGVSGTDYDMVWMDILKIVVFAFNAFAYIEPFIQTGTPEKLASFLVIQPRATLDTAAAETLDWAERKKQPGRHRIEGVLLNGNNFQLQQENHKGSYVLERSIAISDYEIAQSSQDDALYWVAADWNSANTEYERTNPYSKSGLIEPYYSGMISAGDGISGRVDILFEEFPTVFNPVPVGTVIDPDGLATDYYLVTKVNLGTSRLATIEGIKHQ